LSERILDDRPNLYVNARVQIDCLSRDHHHRTWPAIEIEVHFARGVEKKTRDRQIKAKSEKRNLPQSSGRAEKAFSQNQIAFAGWGTKIIAVAALTYLRRW
jgi:hypothetical protein